jgi:hypothetical protein
MVMGCCQLVRLNNDRCVKYEESNGKAKVTRNNGEEKRKEQEEDGGEASFYARL